MLLRNSKMLWVGIIIILVTLFIWSQNNNIDLINENIESMEPEGNISLEIGQGEVCKPYVPIGNAVFETNWEGDFPEIDKFNGKYETATFGMGWFWGPAARYAVLDGVLRTRVGYSGGRSTNPTYKSSDQHTEVVEIDYDPTQISYEDLVEIFFAKHNETLKPYDVRVKSLIFYRNDEQKRVAERILERIRSEAPEDEYVYTELKSFEVLYLAEDEHQNRSLKLEPSIYNEIKQMYETEENILNSILAAKLNGYIYGYGSPEGALELLEKSGLSEPSRLRLLEVIENRPYVLE